MTTIPTGHEPVDEQRVHNVFDWLEFGEERTAVLELLTIFHSWLATEAMAAGGIGPAEAGRLWSRHIADSLTFLAGLGHPKAVVDIGSGVGLPGIPLAIALPEVDFSLLDRSERRCDLADRAVRILELENVEVVRADYRRVTLPHDTAVSRAVTAPADLVRELRKLLPGGTSAVLGGSFGASEPPQTSDLEILRVPPEVLGEAAWLVKVSLSA
jgi:16S rRNA (guanine527-N7)-methyltransferase